MVPVLMPEALATVMVFAYCAPPVKVVELPPEKGGLTPVRPLVPNWIRAAFVPMSFNFVRFAPLPRRTQLLGRDRCVLMRNVPEPSKTKRFVPQEFRAVWIPEV